MKIGVVGEYPTDVFSICNLLSQKYSFTFFPLLRRINGSQLDQTDNSILKNQLRREFQFERPNLVLFIRDLDSVSWRADYRKQVGYRKAFFSSFNKVVSKRGLFLLNIYELEALILADLSTFNRLYSTDLKISERPEDIPDPKGWLVRESGGRYNPSGNKSIFQQLRIETVSNNCDYFKEFLVMFERKTIKSKPM